jgi:hypothetical protein
MNKQQSDQALAMKFLAGAVENHNGAISLKYLEPGSESEAAAQQALVRVLRNAQPLSNAIRSMIAALLDPNHPLEGRKIVIQLRRKGKQPRHARDLWIAADIAAELATGRKLESALRNAEQRYSVTRRTVLRAWKAHRFSPLVRSVK